MKLKVSRSSTSEKLAICIRGFENCI